MRKRDHSQKLLKKSKKVFQTPNNVERYNWTPVAYDSSNLKKHLLLPYDEESLEAPLEKLQKLLCSKSDSFHHSENSNNNHTESSNLVPKGISSQEETSHYFQSTTTTASVLEKQHFERCPPESETLYTKQLQTMDSSESIDWYISKYSDTSIIENFGKCGPFHLFHIGWKQKIVERVVSLRQFSGYSEHLSKTEEQLLGLVCSYWMDGIFELPDYHLQAKLMRPVYLAHIANYVIRCRQRIMRNNRIQQTVEESSTLSETLKDQGFTRPRVLILLPMRNFAHQVVVILLELLKDKHLKNYERFEREFYEDNPTDSQKPLDYIQLFQGNTDDDFCMGIKMGTFVHLFSDYYRSDIIVASPLGLRRWMEEYSADLLSNIEICVVEGADVMDMQNWDHVRYVFEHMNQLPKRLHGTDISRITQRALEEKTKYFRQTMLFTNYIHRSLLSLWRMHCHNMEGKARYIPSYLGFLLKRSSHNHLNSNGKMNIRQTFERLPTSHCNIKESIVRRREYFVNVVLSRYSIHTSPVLIFIPSYFDYVQIRNIFYQKQKAGELTFGTLCEYSSEKHIDQEKKAMKEKSKQYVLMTERFYFYHRESLSGISRLIFYQLPEHGIFYEELVSSLEMAATCIPNVLVLYDHFDALSLERIAGTLANKIWNKNFYILG